MFKQLQRLLRHGWLDASDAHRAVPPELLARLTGQVAASERRHGGQIRICVEAGLPMSYLWRHLRQRVPMPQIVRERALMMFSKLRVWDTERNNGVLIYLLLAEHAIEIVADRGLNRHVSPAEWQAMARAMGAAFRAGHFEEGLSQTLEQVSTLLVAHFPADAAAVPGGNELPDQPVLG